MGIQPRNAMTAQGYLNSLQSLGTVNQNTGYNPQAARRNTFAETWGSGQRGAPNYNRYMDRSNRDNYSQDGAWRGKPGGPGLAVTPLLVSQYGLGGTGPSEATLAGDRRRFEMRQARNDGNRTRNANMRNNPLYNPAPMSDTMKTLYKANTGNSQQTPGIYVPGSEPAPSGSDPIPPSNLLGSTPKDVTTEISAPPTGMSSENPLMNTMKPKQKPKYGTLGASRGFNGMGLGPNSVAKPGTYGTY